MANKPSWSKQAGVTPGKLVLIGVLAVVLVGVLYVQYAPQASPPLAPTTPALPTASAAPNVPLPVSATLPAATSETAAPRKKTGAVASWHSPQLPPIVFDPFALPAAFPQPTQVDAQTGVAPATTAEEASAQQAALAAERTKSETELAGLRQQGVAVIIKSKKEWFAIVGNQEVHVGDEINGFTVIAIDADGVRVAKDLNP